MRVERAFIDITCPITMRMGCNPVSRIVLAKAITPRMTNGKLDQVFHHSATYSDVAYFTSQLPGTGKKHTHRNGCIPDGEGERHRERGRRGDGERYRERGGEKEGEIDH